jgi:hypothetical protein
LAKERPEMPIDFLIDFLEKHKHEHVWKVFFFFVKSDPSAFVCFLNGI